jgi:Ca-activated chloride channel family protein
MRVVDMGGQSRLEAAKSVLQQFVEVGGQNRLALIGFAGSAHVFCPFTLDHTTLLSFLDNLDPDSVEEQGTMLGVALSKALERFEPDSKVGKAVLLLTDGEDQGSNPLEAARAARERGIVVYAIGLGSDAGGPVPVGVGPLGDPIYKRFHGTDVVSRLDETALREMARTTGGIYFRAETPERLGEVLQAISQMDNRAVVRQQIELRDDIFAWYLAPALCLLALEPVVRLRRRRRANA